PNPTGTSLVSGPGAVHALAVDDAAVYIGGDFTSIGGLPHRCLAAVATMQIVAVRSASSGRTALLGPIAPNPSRDRTRIYFTLPKAERVTVSVLDVAGREVARVVDEPRCEAGAHRAEFRAAGLPSGEYLCRIRAGRAEETRKLVVTR